MPPTIPFGEYRPDMPELSQWAREALNVVPAEESYTPFNALATVTNALGSRCQGAGWFRCPDGSSKMFAGDASKLYLLSSGTTWNDVSRTSGGGYAPPSDGAWRFDQFGNLAIAVNGVDAPQKFDLNAGSNWTALGGSPPVATHLAVVKDFLVLGNLAGLPQRLQWCGLNNCEDWGAGQPIPGTNPATQADFNDEPDGGHINGLIGGEYGLIVQESAVRRMTYIGSPAIFQIDKIAKDLGTSVPASIAGVEARGFFLHKSGFYMVQDGQTLVPIGRGKVDKTFWKEFDEANGFRGCAAIDPVRGLYVFAYPSASSSGNPNKMLIYNWRIDRWSRAEQTSEVIFSGVTQRGYTLEDLDAFGTLETLPFSLDSSFWIGTTSLLLFGFNTDHTAGAFAGSILPATIETAETAPGKGRRGLVRSCRPLIDGGAPMVSLGYRESQQSSVAYTQPVSLTGAGMAPLRRSSRYFRYRATIPGGSNWSNAVGIDDVDFNVLGSR